MVGQDRSVETTQKIINRLLKSQEHIPFNDDKNSMMDPILTLVLKLCYGIIFRNIFFGGGGDSTILYESKERSTYCR
jgi:hypothetical protein